MKRVLCLRELEFKAGHDVRCTGVSLELVPDAGEFANQSPVIALQFVATAVRASQRVVRFPRPRLRVRARDIRCGDSQRGLAVGELTGKRCVRVARSAGRR